MFALSMFMLSYIFVIVCCLLGERECVQVFLWFVYICILVENQILKDHIGGLMVSFCATNAVYWVESWSDQTKGYKIGTCCVSTTNAALWSNSKDWLVQNLDNVMTECCFCQLAL